MILIGFVFEVDWSDVRLRFEMYFGSFVGKFFVVLYLVFFVELECGVFFNVEWIKLLKMV